MQGWPDWATAVLAFVATCLIMAEIIESGKHI